jgi:hypothetical protein
MAWVIYDKIKWNRDKISIVHIIPYLIIRCFAPEQPAQDDM